MKKEVTILGAGLVGSLLTVYLAKRGYKVDLYERRPDMRKEKIVAGRSINLALSDRGWKGLAGAGLKEEIEKVAIQMKGRMVHMPDGTQSFQPYGREGQAIYSVSRGGLNMTLMDLAEKQQNVKLHFNHRCTDVDLDKGIAHFETEKGGTKTIESSLIFGADGAFSALRSSMQKRDRFDYNQFYIEHGYKELTIPDGEGGKFLMEKNALHIWPRKNFMLIALPNLDGSFTCTLFFQFEGNPSFATVKTDKEIEHFFEEYFPDVIPLMPTYKEDFLHNPTSSLVTVKCFPWAYKDKAALIGDAAHAIVPFFGQGMNCGFEDCTVLGELMDKHGEDWNTILHHFEQLRKPNADAIAELALNNFIEMRDLVADPKFLRKKQIEKMIAQSFPENFIPAYPMVTFTHMPYSEALRRGKKQDELLERLYLEKDLEANWNDPNIQAVVKEYLS
jgi:kynurenine 3-monooxygenase